MGQKVEENDEDSGAPEVEEQAEAEEESQEGEEAASHEGEAEEGVEGSEEAGAEPEDNEESDEDRDEDSERRRGRRKGVRLNKLIAAELQQEDGGTRSAYLHLVDISEGGFRFNSDDPLPEPDPFKMTLALDAFGSDVATEYPRDTFEMEVVWKKELIGGMWVTGVKLVAPTETNRAVIKKILERSSPEGRRLRFRLNRVLGVELGREDGVQWVYPLALDLSVEGMRIRLDQALEVGASLSLKIFLEFDLPTVETEAKVVWMEEMASGRHQVGLKFFNMEEEHASTIKNYIDKCLEQDSKRR